MEFLLTFIQKYPIFSQIIFVIGALRIIFKPLMSIIQNYVDYTPSPKDNEFLKKIMDSFLYQKFVWFIDYIGSIKLPK